MAHISMTQAAIYAKQMAFNKTHVLTVARDWYENGKQYWRVLHGHELEGGFELTKRATRTEALTDALQIAKAIDEAQPLIIGYEHGYRNFRWVDVPHYRATGKVRHR